MSIAIGGGLNSVKDIYIGNKKVTEAYVGNELVYKKKIWLVKDGQIKNFNLWNTKIITYPGNGIISSYSEYQSFYCIGGGIGMQSGFNIPQGLYKLFIKGTIGVYLQMTFSRYTNSTEMGLNINNKTSGTITPTGYSPLTYSLEYTFNDYAEGEISYYGPYSAYLVNYYMANQKSSTFYIHIYFKSNANLYMIEN